MTIALTVIVGVDETVTQDDNGTEVGGSTEAWESFYANQPWHEGLTCKRTSYNTYRDYKYTYDDSEPPQVSHTEYFGSKHRTGGTPFRGQYASIGDYYDADLDEFTPSPVVEDAPE